MKPTRHVKQDYVRSSPAFFRLIAAAGLIFTLLVLCGTILLPAPLLAPADVGAPPNPAKSAWFLLWIQELVSHGTLLIYPVMALGLVFLLLPWLPLHRPIWRASWFSQRQLWVNILTITAFIGIIVLTVVAALFRGPQWQFVIPF